MLSKYNWVNIFQKYLGGRKFPRLSLVIFLIIMSFAVFRHNKPPANLIYIQHKYEICPKVLILLKKKYFLNLVITLYFRVRSINIMLSCLVLGDDIRRCFLVEIS